MLVLAYKDFTAETEFDWVDLTWIGHVVNTDDTVGFQGTTVEEAEKNFHEAVDAYIARLEELEKDLDEAV